MADRFVKLSEFKDGLKGFTAADYSTFAPFSHLIDCAMVNVPHYNCARYKQYAKLLLIDAVAKGCDTAPVQAEIDKYYVTTVLQQDKSNYIANLVEKVAADKETKDKVSVLPLVCGSGKSTAISYLIKRVIERNDRNGILIVTDSLERMKEYTHPDSKRDPELASFLKDNSSKIITLESGKRLPMLLTMQASVPVLIMSTQRYFNLSVDEIKEFLKWGENGTRPLILFDEAVYMTKMEKVSRKHFNDVSTVLNEGIHWTDDPELRQRCIDRWETIRERIWTFIKETESGLNQQDYYRYCAFPNGTLTEDADSDEEFLNFIAEHEDEIARYDSNINDEWHTIETIRLIKRMLTEGCLYHCGKRGSWYEGSFSMLIDNSEKITDVDAKVIIMDGTAEIHPDYQQDFIDMRDGSKYERALDNLDLRFIGGLKTDKSYYEENCKLLTQLIAAYMYEKHPNTDIAAFTYDSTEAVAKEHFSDTAHFGAIKGKNEFRNYSCIAQLGMFRFPESFYLTYFLWQNKQHLEAIKALDLEHTADYLKNLVKTQEYQITVSRFLLADLEQNMFRSTIRQSDSVDPAHYYVFCDIERYALLFSLAQRKYGLYDANVQMQNETDYFWLKQIELTPQGKLKNEYKLRYWIYKLPSGTLFSTRKSKIEGEECRLMLSPEESGITHKQYEKVKENNPEFADYMRTMAVPDRNGYFIKH